MGLLNPWAQYLRETIDLMALKTWKRWQKRNRLAWVCLPYPLIELKRAHEHYLNLVGTKGRAPTHCSAVVFESQCCRLGNRQSLEVKAKVHVFFPGATRFPRCLLLCLHSILQSPSTGLFRPHQALVCPKAHLSQVLQSSVWPQADGQPALPSY